MPDQQGDTTEGSTDNLVTMKRSQIKVIEDKAKKYDAVKAERDKAVRDLAVSQAGLPQDDPKINFFLSHYDGESTAEAIRQAATEAGFMDSTSQPATGQQEGIPVEEQQAQQRIEQASDTVGAPQADQIMAGMEKAMAEGGTQGLLEFARQQGMPTTG